MVIMDFVIQASPSLWACSIADALKTGKRNLIIQRTFDHYFSAFLQSSSSLKHYEDRNFILQKDFSVICFSGRPWPISKAIFETITALICCLFNYARLRFCIFLSHKQNLCTGDRLENQYTWKWKKTKPDRKTYDGLVNEQRLRLVLDVTGRKKYIMALRLTCLCFFFLIFFVVKFISSLVLKLDNLWCSLIP